MTSASDEKWRLFNGFFSRVELRSYLRPYILHIDGGGNLGLTNIITFIIIYVYLVIAEMPLLNTLRRTHTHTKAQDRRNKRVRTMIRKFACIKMLRLILVDIMWLYWLIVRASSQNQHKQRNLT